MPLWLGGSLQAGPPRLRLPRLWKDQFHGAAVIHGELATEPMLSSAALALGLLAAIATALLMWLGNAIHSRLKGRHRKNVRGHIGFRDRDSRGHFGNFWRDNKRTAQR